MRTSTEPPARTDKSRFFKLGLTAARARAVGASAAWTARVQGLIMTTDPQGAQEQSPSARNAAATRSAARDKHHTAPYVLDEYAPASAAPACDKVAASVKAAAGSCTACCSFCSALEVTPGVAQRADVSAQRGAVCQVPWSAVVHDLVQWGTAKPRISTAEAPYLARTATTERVDRAAARFASGAAWKEERSRVRAGESRPTRWGLAESYRGATSRSARGVVTAGHGR